MTSRDDIGVWFDQAVGFDATHLIVVVDDFDHEDYPVFVRIDPTVKETESRREGRVIVTNDIQPLLVERFSTNGQRVMECYDLNLDRDMQLNEPRAYHI